MPGEGFLQRKSLIYSGVCMKIFFKNLPFEVKF